MQVILELLDAPKITETHHASEDVLTVIRSLVDAAGQRTEEGCDQLLRRVEGAVWGYLSSQERHPRVSDESRPRPEPETA